MARVIVGVDGSEGSRRALVQAAIQAELRGEPLLVVIGWSLSVVPNPYPIAIDPKPYERNAENTVEQMTAELRLGHPGLAIETEVVNDDPRQALIERVHPDDLLVVGTRGHGGVVGLLLGSVATYCIRHAPCPVLVVPPAA